MSDDEYYDRRNRSNSRGRSRSQNNSKKPPPPKAKTGKVLDMNYKPINILVYRNGDEYDPGTIIAITRKRFRNWVSLLDNITGAINLKDGAVHHLYDSNTKEEARHFKDLIDGNTYVATHRRFDRATKYGSRPNYKWVTQKHVKGDDPGAIESGESYCMYLEKKQFKPTLDDMWEDSGFDLKRGGDESNNSSSSSSSNNKQRSSSTRR